MFYIDGSVVLLTERRSRFSSLGRTPSVSSCVVASWSTSLAGTAVEVLGIGAGLMKDVSSSSGLSGLSSGDAISAYSLTEWGAKEVWEDMLPGYRGRRRKGTGFKEGVGGGEVDEVRMGGDIGGLPLEPCSAAWIWAEDGGRLKVLGRGECLPSKWGIPAEIALNFFWLVLR